MKAAVHDGAKITIKKAPVDKIYSEFVEIDIKKVRDKKLNSYNDIFEDRRKDFYKV